MNFPEDLYNGNEIFIFLLSTRAAGLGINLTSASAVIFYDVSFNPQVDRQAEDRCHRLGQTKKVEIIKLITKNSCEEEIFQMATEKKELNDIMLSEGAYGQQSATKKKNQYHGDDEISNNNSATLLGNLFLLGSATPKKHSSKKKSKKHKKIKINKTRKNKHTSNLDSGDDIEFSLASSDLKTKQDKKLGNNEKQSKRSESDDMSREHMKKMKGGEKTSETTNCTTQDTDTNLIELAQLNSDLPLKKEANFVDEIESFVDFLHGE